MSDFLKVLFVLLVIMVPAFVYPQLLPVFLMIGMFLLFYSARQKKTIIVEGNCEHLFNTIQQAFAAEKLNVTAYNRENYALEYKTSLSWDSFGEKVKINLTPLKDGKIEIVIMSELVFGFYDYFRMNDKNIVKIEALLGLTLITPTHTFA